jgi:hypothetical protein
MQTNDNTTYTSNDNKVEIEYETMGTKGVGKILKSPSGQRTVEVKWHKNGKLQVESTRVDLEKAKSTSLRTALDKACHVTGFLPLFHYEQIKGPKALINMFYRVPENNEGYATIVKKGKKTLRFSLDRLDLNKMECTSARDALKKAAYSTGSVLIQYKEEKRA